MDFPEIDIPNLLDDRTDHLSKADLTSMFISTEHGSVYRMEEKGDCFSIDMPLN